MLPATGGQHRVAGGGYDVVDVDAAAGRYAGNVREPVASKRVAVVVDAAGLSELTRIHMVGGRAGECVANHR